MRKKRQNTNMILKAVHYFKLYDFTHTNYSATDLVSHFAQHHRITKQDQSCYGLI